MKRMLGLLLLSLFALAGVASAAEARIAVAADGAGADAAVSAAAARAPHVLFFDAKGALLESAANPAAASPGGAGPALAQWLAQKGATVLVAGDFGLNLTRALEANKIRYVKKSGPARQAALEAAR